MDERLKQYDDKMQKTMNKLMEVGKHEKPAEEAPAAEEAAVAEEE